MVTWLSRSGSEQPAQLRLQDVVEELERVLADGRVARAHADVGIVQPRAGTSSAIRRKIRSSS